MPEYNVGQTAKDKDGRTIVYTRNGWVYAPEPHQADATRGAAAAPGKADGRSTGWASGPAGFVAAGSGSADLPPPNFRSRYAFEGVSAPREPGWSVRLSERSAEGPSVGEFLRSLEPVPDRSVSGGEGDQTTAPRKSSVRLSDDLTGRVDQLYSAVRAATGGQGFYVTDGMRSPSDQARAMYKNYGPGEPTYKNRAAAAEIRAVYEDGRKQGLSREAIIANMASVIQGQVDNGAYISKHMSSKGMDIRLSTPASVIDAIRANPNIESILREDDHWHVQFK